VSTPDVAPKPHGGHVAVQRPSRSAGSPWWTRRAVGLHLTLVVVVPAFVALFWWQIERVREGNTLSWAYVFEWPFFTGYAIYMWWKLVHDPLGPPDVAAATGDAADLAGPTDVVDAADARGAAGTRGAEGAGGADDTGGADDELAAYNRYLAELDASGRPKRW